MPIVVWSSPSSSATASVTARADLDLVHATVTVGVEAADLDRRHVVGPRMTGGHVEPVVVEAPGREADQVRDRSVVLVERRRRAAADAARSNALTRRRSSRARSASPSWAETIACTSRSAMKDTESGAGAGRRSPRPASPAAAPRWPRSGRSATPRRGSPGRTHPRWPAARSRSRRASRSRAGAPGSARRRRCRGATCAVACLARQRRWPRRSRPRSSARSIRRRTSASRCAHASSASSAARAHVSEPTVRVADGAAGRPAGAVAELGQIDGVGEVGEGGVVGGPEQAAECALGSSGPPTAEEPADPPGPVEQVAGLRRRRRGFGVEQPGRGSSPGRRP